MTETTLLSIDEASRQLGTLADACEGHADAGEALRRLRLLLVQIGPRLHGFDQTKVDDRFERLLENGAEMSAAILLAGDIFGYMVSSNPAGVAIASAWIPDRSEQHTVRGDDPATALVGAMARAAVQAIAGGPAPVSAAIN